MGMIQWDILLTSFLHLLGLAAKAAVLLVVGLLLLHWGVRLTKSGLQKSRLDVSLHHFVLSCLRIVGYVFIAMVVMQAVGIPVTSLITAIGAAGVAVGLALRDSLANFASGIVLLVNHPFKLGDFVDINGSAGVATEIGLMCSTITTVDNCRVVLPNNAIVNGKVINYSAEDKRRLDMNFTIGYKDDPELAMSLIRGILKQKPVVLNEPAEPFLRMTEHGASAITLTLRVWVNGADLWNLKFDLLEEVKRAFDQNGINIPYNQLDVHLVDKE